MADLDLGRFDVLTFDCYGTLIDWESGIVRGLREVLETHGAGRTATDDELLEHFARQEAAAESGPYLRYREVLARALRGVCEAYGFLPSEVEEARFGGSVGDWPAFPDSANALERLAQQFRLGIITNCDDDLFALSQARLGIAFDWVVTAQQVGTYKPDELNFLVAMERIPFPPARILHVAQSLFHDHVPAKKLGLSTVWVDRRRGRSGSGPTPPATAAPDLTVPDLASLADLAGTA